ncbi:MAG: glycosyltransferase family 39 protein, partial [Deltaproteobacteria bacterium]|nr:glycosyltransferase family 39 protein [Deltaproteobacteria bacterium]
VPLKDVAQILSHNTAQTFLNFGAYLQAFLHYTFGPSLMNILCLPFFGIWVVIMVYILSLELYNHRVAILSSAMVALFPPFLLYSTSNIRMIIGVLAFLITIYSLIKFFKKNSLKNLLPLLLATLLIYFSKSRLLIPYAVIVSLISFFIIRMNSIVRGSLILIICISAFTLIKIHPMANAHYHAFTSSLLDTHKFFATYENGNNYKIFDEDFYEQTTFINYPLSKVVKALPKGIAYYILCPFLWNMRSFNQLIAYPHTLLWYFILAFSLFGFWMGFQFHFSQTFCITVFMLYWIILFSLASGNIGTAARQRDLLTPLFCIFASVGLLRLFELFPLNKPLLRNYSQ